MKEKLLKLLKAKKEQRDALNKSMIESDSKEERAAIGETLKRLADEIREVEEMLDEIDEPAGGAAGDQNNSRGMNPLDAMKMDGGDKQKRENEDPHDTKEYRTAFMNFVCRGVPIPAELRTDAVTTTTDASAVIPTTILNEITK